MSASPDTGFPSVSTLVNGRDLVDLAREAERASAAETGQPELAGAYAGLSPEEWFDLAARVVAGEGEGGFRTAVLGCECGVTECWPLEARVAVRRDAVTLDAFAQPYRPGWRHDALGPFAFQRGRFLATVEALRSEAGPREA